MFPENLRLFHAPVKFYAHLWEPGSKISLSFWWNRDVHTTVWDAWGLGCKLGVAKQNLSYHPNYCLMWVKQCSFLSIISLTSIHIDLNGLKRLSQTYLAQSSMSSYRRMCLHSFIFLTWPRLPYAVKTSNCGKSSY